MAVMIAKVYDALRDGSRFGRIETDLTLLKWMVGTNLVLTIAALGKLLAPA